MKRICSFLLGCGLSFLGLCAAANAAMSAQQPSNSLQAVPESQQIDIQALQDKGYILFDPESVKAMLAAQGMTILSDSPARGNTPRIITTSVSQQLFLFAFVDCVEAGCLIMQPVHIVPTMVSGYRTPPSVVNELNTKVPFGHLAALPDGNALVRVSMFAVPECADACRDAMIEIFIRSSLYAHRLLRTESGRAIASFSDESAEALSWQDFAGFAAPQDKLADALVSFALGNDAFAAVTEQGAVNVSYTVISNAPGFEDWELNWPTLLPASGD